MDLSTYLGEYKEAQEWQITHNNTDRVLTPRDEGVVLMYSRRVALKFTLSMKRVPGFKALLLTMPCLLLSLLTIVVFVLSPDRPDRHMLGVYCPQNQKAVSVYLKSKHLLPTGLHGVDGGSTLNRHKFFVQRLVLLGNRYANQNYTP